MTLIIHLLGFLSLALGTFMVPSLIISIYDGGSDTALFAISSGICIVVGAAVAGLTRNHRGTLGLRDAFKVVTMAWFLAGVLGSLPYFIGSFMERSIDTQLNLLANSKRRSA